MKNVLIVVIVLCAAMVSAQTVGKMDLRMEGYGQKKFSLAPKKIYVETFVVNYQMMYDQVEIAQGGREIGGGVRGKAKAQLVLGLSGLSETDVQGITDDLWVKYKAKLEAKGFELLSADDMKSHSKFAGQQIVKGGKMTEGIFPGYLTSMPTGFMAFEKEANKKMKAGMVDLGMNLSKELDGVIVARVSLVVPFVQGAESQGSKALTKTFGGVAKIVVKPSLGIIRSESMEVRGKLAAKTIFITSGSSFAFKTGLKNQAISKAIPKKLITVNGVLEDKKYKAVQSADQDLWGTDYGAITVFSASDSVKEIMQAVPCDATKYVKGVSEAGWAYLDASIGDFTSGIK